uniref:Secreted protein n=1 Tax=Quercus lobata TaxID=97700 RepID=A0A7N2MNT6_QUELO
MTVLLFVTMLFASSQVGAMRPLEGEQWLKKESLLLQSVQRGPVTGSGSNLSPFANPLPTHLSVVVEPPTLRCGRASHTILAHQPISRSLPFYRGI